MGLIISIIVGGIIGWLAGMIMGSGNGILMNIIVGIIGSALGSWLFGSVLKIGGAHAAGSFNVPGLVFGILGAVVLIFLLRLLGIGA